MSNERCANCEGIRKIDCDSIREDVARKLALLMEWQNLCNGFGTPQPACVTEAAYDLNGIGCTIPSLELVKDLNPEGIS